MSAGTILDQIIDAILALLGGRKSLEELSVALDKKAAEGSERLDWRHSIVDLMKLVGMDSGLPAREKMARELGYTGELNGSAEMNNWLHARVMEKLR